METVKKEMHWEKEEETLMTRSIRHRECPEYGSPKPTSPSADARLAKPTRSGNKSEENEMCRDGEKICSHFTFDMKFSDRRKEEVSKEE